MPMFTEDLCILLHLRADYPHHRTLSIPLQEFPIYAKLLQQITTHLVAQKNTYLLPHSSGSQKANISFTELESGIGRVGSFWRLYRENLFTCFFQLPVAAHISWFSPFPHLQSTSIQSVSIITFLLPDSSCVPVIRLNLQE